MVPVPTDSELLFIVCALLAIGMAMGVGAVLFAQWMLA